MYNNFHVQWYNSIRIQWQSFNCYSLNISKMCIFVFIVWTKYPSKGHQQKLFGIQNWQIISYWCTRVFCIIFLYIFKSFKKWIVYYQKIDTGCLVNIKLHSLLQFDLVLKEFDPSIFILNVEWFMDFPSEKFWQS